MERVRPATVPDAVSIAARLRAADREECLAATGLPPEIVLPSSVLRKPVNVALNDDGTPEVLFGADGVPSHPNVAVVWMVSTGAIHSHPTEFLRQSLKWVDCWHEKFDVLTNFVDARNTLHHKWLRWLGFSFLRKVDSLGPYSLPFYEFAKIKHVR